MNLTNNCTHLSNYSVNFLPTGALTIVCLLGSLNIARKESSRQCCQVKCVNLAITVVKFSIH